MSVWRGLGGNREVPPIEILGGAEGNSEEEGGTWGKHGFPHGSEPEASDAHSVGLPRTVARGRGRTSPAWAGGGSDGRPEPAASPDQGGEVTPSRMTR
jgi:hypothetical protein